MTGAELLVKCLEAAHVEYIFGIPGAKIDRVFDALLDSKIKLIVCRHEQNAAFIAAAYGRLTGKPGVVLVTSGPGVANLVTGLLTATTEGDPVVAIGGNVARSMMLKQSHQSTKNSKLMEAVTKKSVEVSLADNIPEIVANAFCIALATTRGAVFISVPQDVLTESTSHHPIPYLMHPSYGGASKTAMEHAASLINKAKKPLILLGMQASFPKNTEAIRDLLKQNHFMVVSTYQGAGIVSKELIDYFVGRVGLFKNQPGDKMIDQADVVLTIGFNPVEYDPEIWNSENKKIIVHLDCNMCDIHGCYSPISVLLGDIATNVQTLSSMLTPRDHSKLSQLTIESQKELFTKIESGKYYKGSPVHPLRFIYELREAIDDSTTICCDIGTHYMWMARYFLSYRPRQLLFSNGQQTLGVGLPWAIACNYACPGKPVVSISGDGGFLFSAMELETAVREGLHFVHFIWQDGTYNMVLEQEMIKYHRKSGVDFGPVNIPDFAKAFGAIGLELEDPDHFQEVFKEARKAKKPVLINVPIDYRDNLQLFESVDPDSGH